MKTICLIAGAAMATSNSGNLMWKAMTTTERKAHEAKLVGLRKSSCDDALLMCKNGHCKCRAAMTAKGLKQCRMKKKSWFTTNNKPMKSGEVGCEDKMDPCKKRYDEDASGMDKCKGKNCMLVGKVAGKMGCQFLSNKCKIQKKNKMCDKKKHYKKLTFNNSVTVKGAEDNAICCKSCYRKTKNVPCLMDNIVQYKSMNTQVKQGEKKVATWSPWSKHMVRAKNKICCLMNGTRTAENDDNAKAKGSKIMNEINDELSSGVNNDGLG